MESNANLNAAGIYTSGFAFGNNCIPVVCVKTHIFRPLGWTPSTSTTSTTSTSTTSTTSSTTSTTSTSTTTVPITTTTSTTIGLVYRHEITNGAESGLLGCFTLIYPVIAYSLSEFINSSSILYLDETLTSPFPGNDLWYKDIFTEYSWQINDVGEVFDSFLCTGATTTTTTTTIAPCTAFVYFANIYNCDTCLFLGGIAFTNSEQLTLGQYYHSPIDHTSWFVAEEDPCITDTPQYSILDSSKQALCTASCITTTTTTTV